MASITETRLPKPQLQGHISSVGHKETNTTKLAQKKLAGLGQSYPKIHKDVTKPESACSLKKSFRTSNSNSCSSVPNSVVIHYNGKQTKTIDLEPVHTSSPKLNSKGISRLSIAKTSYLGLKQLPSQKLESQTDFDLMHDELDKWLEQFDTDGSRPSASTESNLSPASDYSNRSPSKVDNYGNLLPFSEAQKANINVIRSFLHYKGTYSNFLSDHNLPKSTVKTSNLGLRQLSNLSPTTDSISSGYASSSLIISPHEISESINSEKAILGLISLGLVGVGKDPIIGNGEFGKVLRCSDSAGKIGVKGKKYAVKLFKKKRDTQSQKSFETIRGDTLARGFKHPSIIEYHASFYENTNTGDFRILIKGEALEDPQNWVETGVIFELVEGKDFSSYIYGDQTLNLKQIKNIGRQLLDGIHEMHSKNVIHRDIKPENILFTEGSDSQIKITDFGEARKLEEGQVMNTSVGDASCRAPEMTRRENCSNKVDLWSLGLILYQMRFKKFPDFLQKAKDTGSIIHVLNAVATFEKQHHEKLHMEIQKQKSTLITREERKLLDLIQKLVCPEKDRLRASEALQHPFFE